MNRNCPSYVTALLSALLCAAISSCTGTNNKLAKQRGGQQETAKALSQPPKPKLYEWKGEGLEGQAAIKVALDEQKAYFTVGGQDAGWTYLASGTSSHPSPTGTFKISEKVELKKSNRYGMIVDANGQVIDRDATAGRESIPRGGRFVGAPMPYWMRLTGHGIGMHAGAIPNPGMPASHGCIRLPEELAAIVFDRFDVGTPVLIARSLPKIQAESKPDLQVTPQSQPQEAPRPILNAQPLANGTKPGSSPSASLAMSTLR